VKPPDNTNTKTFVVDVDPAQMARVGVFTVSSGVDAGRILSLPRGQVITFGRSPECTYPFDDPSLSREHAIVMRVGNDYTMRDGGSTNGTFVNDQRLTTASSLKDGDRVQLGLHTLLRFALVSAAEEEALRRVYEAAIKDGLTGIYNRKYLEERLVTELAYAARHQSIVSVIIIDVDFFKKVNDTYGLGLPMRCSPRRDVDFFKKVNDTYGHLAGDAVLKQVSSIFAKGLRPEDVVARYGGEEFVLVLRGTSLIDAATAAERLRREVEATTITFEGTPIRVTSSAGVACSAELGASPEKSALLGAADARLYAAKTGGRNRVVFEG
jgi:diguanylate cyclase (GGDEF)-like protein